MENPLSGFALSGPGRVRVSRSGPGQIRGRVLSQSLRRAVVHVLCPLDAPMELFGGAARYSFLGRFGPSRESIMLQRAEGKDIAKGARQKTAFSIEED